MTKTSNRPTPNPAVSALFPTGALSATPGALTLLERHSINPLTLLARHQQGDWGNLSDDDRAANDNAVTLGNRIISSYTLGEKDKVWIITEHDRSASLILLPSDY